MIPSTAPARHHAPAGAAPRPPEPRPGEAAPAIPPVSPPDVDPGSGPAACPVTAAVRYAGPREPLVPRPRSEPGTVALDPARRTAPRPRPRAAEPRLDQVLRVDTRIAPGVGGRTTVIRVSGELDLAGAPELARELAHAFDHVGPRVVLDMAHLTFADTSGLAPVPGFDRTVREAGGRLALIGVRPLARLVLRSLGHDPVVYRTERDALLARDLQNAAPPEGARD